MNITETFAHHARAVSDRAAIVHGERVLHYRDLDPPLSRVVGVSPEKVAVGMRLRVKLGGDGKPEFEPEV